MSVRIRDWNGIERVAEIGDDGRVLLDGQMIGYVWKGERTYSPPTHRGSRVAKYHKQVAEWQGSPDSKWRPLFHRPTRKAVILALADHAKGS